MPSLPGPFAAWRVVEVHDLQVLQALLAPEQSPRDPEVAAWLEAWPGRRYQQRRDDGTELTFVRRLRPRRRERWGVHALLLALTLLTTAFAGALLAFDDPLALRRAGPEWLAMSVPTRVAPGALLGGLVFSVVMMGVLGGHELGHYVLARRHLVDVSPPYFAPAPWFLNPIGTFGAFIRLRSPLVNRAVLLDVGAAGPLASFVLSIPVTLVGLMLSREYATPPFSGVRMGIILGDALLPMGASPVFSALLALSPLRDAGFVHLHPVAVAGWFGFFFTALNLFPVSQLDGGHVAFSLWPRAHRWVARLTMLLLLAMGLGWGGWWFWALVILVIGRGRLGHPPVVDPHFRLDARRRAVAIATLLAFPLSLTPVPFPI
ncbi:MAG TPA: site-2 protease family protein [Longimicrobium sp.]|nr:site-2 protease family protein [Longimicrobium sp.]